MAMEEAHSGEPFLLTLSCAFAAARVATAQSETISLVHLPACLYTTSTL